MGIFAFMVIVGLLAPEPTPEQLAEREAKRAAEEAEEAAERQAEAQAKIDGAYKITSRELAAAYENNEVRAQQVLGDRDPLVTGRITAITLDFSDDPVVQMQGTNQFLDVQADLNDKSAAAALNKGQTITLLCSEVTEGISAPMLSDCELIEE